MPTFTPVEGNPFEQKPKYKLTPVEGNPFEAQAPKEQQESRKDHGTLNAPLEFMAAFNRGATKLADFLTTDQINAVADILGSEFRVPSITEMTSPGTQGNFMQPGLARDAVRSAGEVAAGGVAGGGALRSAANQLPKFTQASESAGHGVLRQLGATTGSQDLKMAATAGAGTELGGEVGEAVGGEAGRQVGEVAGSMLAPAASGIAKAALPEAARKVLVGGTPKASIKSTIEDFKETGSSPTVAQATNRPSLQAAENLSSQFLGGGRIRRAHEQAERNIQKRLQQIADDVSTKAGADQAGGVIQRGITAPGGFTDRFQAKSAKLWSRVDDQIGRDTAVELDNTKSVLSRLVRDDEFGEVLNNSQLTKIRRILEDADIVDYQTLKELRSTIGRRISSNDLISDIPRAELKQLYGAITEDIKAAAGAAGPQGLANFNRANNFTRSGHARLDGFVERIVKKAKVEEIFSAVTKGGEGAATINSFKRSLTKEEWNVVVSNVVRQMGKANDGQQGWEGEIFSVNKFLTDWNRLGPAKRALFSGTEALNRYGQNLDKIARQVEKMKFSQREAANPSGTGQFAANIGTMAGIPIAAASGQQGVLAGLLGSVVANNLGARLMTNKRLVQWLAESAEIPLSARPEHMLKLAALTKGMTLDEATAVNALLVDLHAKGFEDRQNNL
ncbi:hypothetical protein [uncultured Microbulbifer sp.]|uniref:hypothetical protein n=1 Tax=uncultured Microbulbifer sp. TaxID=348147 RepID=UPI002638C51D|nr:hypothetical protein [uncultured Microbulbifer sp.]